MMSNRYPLRVPHWLQHEVQEADDWSGYADDLDDDEEPIAEDCMAEDYDRAMDELRGLYPQLDDHDRRFDSQYSEANGDIGDNDLPPF